MNANDIHRRGPRALAAGASLIALLAATAPVHAVNLVPNPSFETYSSCPDFLSEIDRAVPWDIPTTGGSSDYYNVCAPGASLVSVPNNSFGTQAPRTGDGYAGIIVRPINDYREYITVPLTSPLIASTTYTVEFWLSLVDLSNQAIDRMGAYLSVGPVGPLPGAPTLPYTPQVESPANAFLSDKVNWMQVTGTYTAAGGESYITIGNFHDNASTNISPLGAGSYTGTYYYVDDVSVTAQPGGPALQACCLGSSGNCTMLEPGECTLVGGTPLGPGTTCGPVPCLPVPVEKLTWGSIKAIYREK